MCRECRTELWPPAAPRCQTKKGDISIGEEDDITGDEDDLPWPPYLPNLEAVVHAGRHDPGALQVEVSTQHFVPGRGVRYITLYITLYISLTVPCTIHTIQFLYSILYSTCTDVHYTEQYLYS